MLLSRSVLDATAIIDSRGRIAKLLPGPQTVGSLRSAFSAAR